MNKRLAFVALLVAGLLLGVGIKSANAEKIDPAAGKIINYTTASYPTTMLEEWFNITFQKRKIGFSFHKIEQGEVGYKMTVRAVIRLSIMEEVQDLSFTRIYYLDTAKQVKNFDSLQKVGSQRQRVTGDVYDDRIEMIVYGAGGSQSLTQETDGRVEFLEPLALTYIGHLKVGMKKGGVAFLPSLRALAPYRFAVTERKVDSIDGVETELFKVQAGFDGYMVESWVSQDGRTFNEYTPLMDMATTRTDEATAIRMPNATLPISSLITVSLIRPNKPIEHQTSIKSMTFEIDGLSSPRDLLRDQRQVGGDPIWSDNPDTGVRSMTLPVTVTKRGPSQKISRNDAAEAMPEQLTPSPEIQSKSPEIIKLGRQIVGKETDLWRSTQAINHWVNSNIEKKLVDSFSALDVLRSRKGECQAHTNLFVALARSQNIPARVVTGLVHSPMEKGFLYHAWPEVWVGNEWIPIDPTLGQDVADVTHIKLVEDSADSNLKLFKFIGKVSIRVQ
jgi:hypothetical protein